jgi:hypothetical protein
MSTPRLALYLVIFASCACGATSIRAAETTSPTGLWKNEDATFEIFESGGKLSARIVALREPKTPEGKEKTDIHNPDRSKQDRPIIGLVFMSGFSRKSDTRWEKGTIYDRQHLFLFHGTRWPEYDQGTGFHWYLTDRADRRLDSRTMKAF